MIDKIESELQKLQDRNLRVELDKAWERSLTRRGFIAFVTYFVAVLWLHFINEMDIWVKAVVPVFGYILSTLSIPILKSIWVKNRL